VIMFCLGCDLNSRVEVVSRFASLASFGFRKNRGTVDAEGG
jgi:hypothetical protein